jgi:hypothetical protein
MIAGQLPSPELYDDWRSFAAALLVALEDLVGQAQGGDYIGHVVTTTPVDPSQLPPLPAGYYPLWLNNADANLYLGTEDYDPPPAPNIVFIDTQNIANAAIELQKLADGAVGTTAKLADAVVLNAKIGDATILRAKIGDGEIVNAKIGSLAVNEAKIADLAVTSAKIANLAVGSAHIQLLAVNSAHIADAAIVNAKIGNTIQSNTWNAGTKAGWLIDKNGNIQGQGISIYDNTGSLIFGAGGTVDFTRLVFDYNKLTKFEKQTTFKSMQAAIEAAYQYARARAVELAVSTATMDTAWTTWTAYLDALTPHVNDFNQDTTLYTPIAPIDFPGGMTGTAIVGTYGPYTTLTDNNAADYLVKLLDVPKPVNALPYTIGYTVRKDQTGYATRGVRFEFTFLGGGGTKDHEVYFDTQTGQFSSNLGASGPYGVLDLGTEWLVWMQMTDASLHNFARARIVPAIGSGAFGSANASAQGTVDIRSILIAQGTLAALGRDYLLGLYNSTIAAIDAQWVLVSQKDATTALTTGLTGAALTTLATNLIGQFTSSNISTYIAAAAIQTAQIADAQITTAKIANLQVTNAHIADLAVTNAKIADATIASAKIVSLDANKINAASLSAITATIGLLRTATSGARLEVESNQIRVYDSSNVLRVRMGIW